MIISNRYNGNPIHMSALATVKEAVEEATGLGISLDYANLFRANLYGANLFRANLYGANLFRANLTGANLFGANLIDADLTGANLAGANLERANLAGANLAGANLERTDLTWANLTGVNLTWANLEGVKVDFREVLDAAPNEVPALLLAIREGRIDGSQYEGDCSCLKGTIDTLRGNTTPSGPLRHDASSPSERLFLAIREGYTPEINPIAALVEEWILEWQAERGEGDLIMEQE